MCYLTCFPNFLLKKKKGYGCLELESCLELERGVTSTTFLQQIIGS